MTGGMNQIDNLKKAEMERAHELLWFLFGTLLFAALVYVGLHVVVPSGGPLFPETLARDDALAAAASATELLAVEGLEGDVPASLGGIRTAVDQVAGTLSASDMELLDAAFAEATQSLAQPVAVRHKARLEALTQDLKTALSAISWLDASGTIGLIEAELAKEAPDPGSLAGLFSRVRDEVVRKGERGFWVNGAWRWVDLFFWALFGTLIFLLSEIRKWYDRIGLPGTSFIRYTPWYFVNLIRGPVIALLIVLFLTSVQGEILGVKISFVEAPFTLLIFLAGILGYFSREARDQLEILVERVFPDAWRRARNLPLKMAVQPSSLTLPLGGKAVFRIEPDQDVVWSHAPVAMGTLGERGDFVASSERQHAGEQVTIKAVSARDETEVAIAKVTLTSVQLEIKPADAEIKFTEKATFRVAPDVPVSWSIEPSDVGSIQDGVYTAPEKGQPASAQPGAEVTIRATKKDDRSAFATAKARLVE